MQLLRGCPYGGCAIFFRKSLINHVTMVNMHSDRVCAVILQGSYSYVFINVYLPTEYSNSQSYSDYLATLGELEGFIDSQSFSHMASLGSKELTAH